jgi:hypothetical protein
MVEGPVPLKPAQGNGNGTILIGSPATLQRLLRRVARTLT